MDYLLKKVVTLFFSIMDEIPGAFLPVLELHLFFDRQSFNLNFPESWFKRTCRVLDNFLVTPNTIPKLVALGERHL